MKKFFLVLLSLIIGNVSLSFCNSENKHNNESIHHHHISAFLGQTTNTHYRESDFTAGIEYAYSLPAISKQLAFGLLYEYIWNNHSESIIGIPIFYKISDHFSLSLAPCISLLSEEEFETDETTHETIMKTKDISEFLIRFGASYSFHINSVSIAPTFAVDYSNAHFSLVYGLNFGLSF